MRPQLDDSVTLAARARLGPARPLQASIAEAWALCMAMPWGARARVCCTAC